MQKLWKKSRYFTNCFVLEYFSVSNISPHTHTVQLCNLILNFTDQSFQQHQKLISQRKSSVSQLKPFKHADFSSGLHFCYFFSLSPLHWFLVPLLTQFFAENLIWHCSRSVCKCEQIWRCTHVQDTGISLILLVYTIGNINNLYCLCVSAASWGVGGPSGLSQIKHGLLWQGSEDEFPHLHKHSYWNPDHWNISLDFHSPRCTPFPLMTTKGRNWFLGAVGGPLPPLLEEDPIFGEAEVHEGFWNWFNHWWGSTQVTQSFLWVHVFPQHLLCESPIWWDTREANQLIKTRCCGTYPISVAYMET